MSEQDSKPTGDASLPASEEGTGIIPGDRTDAGDVSKPASEADVFPEAEGGGERQSWPGKSFGSIPPPG